MRKFQCRFGEDVDLDDPKTYNYLPNTTTELRNLLFSEIGFYYCYVNFWHKDVYDKWDSCLSQKERVEQFIKDFTETEKENYANVLWYKEKIFLFQEEIENMC
jgi:hypothetical protein